MAYPPALSPFVTSQPRQYDIQSNFGMFPGERLFYHCELKTGCCQLGDVYHTSLTDTRYVSRIEFCIFCGCCCKRPYNDTSIYLRDVSELRQVTNNPCYRQFCTHECCTCCCCCCVITKRLQLRGSFGSHVVHIHRKDESDFESMITEAIAQHKLPNRN
ncbi:unnamed protein product [Rotaria sordida]|uniref:Uncharacterized protein n=1 Tax=Rotaria sordida TaxID=392033 RepID=A0A818SZS9_9BILA|nr:unnamed protein product [Rotaria sordida]CAF3677068.1 unnamed protein product [Rotaria sordida]